MFISWLSSATAARVDVQWPASEAGRGLGDDDAASSVGPPPDRTTGRRPTLFCRPVGQIYNLSRARDANSGVILPVYLSVVTYDNNKIHMNYSMLR